jgi:hypothetical protein
MHVEGSNLAQGPHARTNTCTSRSFNIKMPTVLCGMVNSELTCQLALLVRVLPNYANISPDVKEAQNRERNRCTHNRHSDAPHVDGLTSPSVESSPQLDFICRL